QHLALGRLAVLDPLGHVAEPTILALLGRQVLGDVAGDQVRDRRRLAALALLAGRITAAINLAPQHLRPVPRRLDAPLRPAADLDQVFAAVGAVVEGERLHAARVGADQQAADLVVPQLAGTGAPDNLVGEPDHLCAPG